MRVISGTYRGLKLATFEGEDIRPTADRVKESLFNILSTRITGANVCDLFCGSGNLGIECLSRGAKTVYFNDLSRESLNLLHKNLSKLKGANNYSVSQGSFESFLQRAQTAFDLIFLDPPYRFDYGEVALQTVAKRKLLAPNGLAVYERDRPFTGEIAGLKKVDERKYGKVYLTFFALTDGAEE